MEEAISLAKAHSVPITIITHSQTLRGVYKAPINLFRYILYPEGHYDVQPQNIEDAIKRTLAACEKAKKRALFNLTNLINPVSWISAFLMIPIVIARMTGLNTKKLENNYLGYIYGAVFWGGILIAATYLGYSPAEITDFIKAILGR